MDWFRIVNIGCEDLREQELRKQYSIYGGPWVKSAKQYFSKPNSPFYKLSGRYLTGSAIRQEYLETAIERHQDDPDANELWNFLVRVIDCVKTIFPKYRSEMNGLDQV